MNLSHWSPLFDASAVLTRKLAPYADTVRRNFQSMDFEAPQRCRREIHRRATRLAAHDLRPYRCSVHLDREDLEMAPFDAKGGMGRMYQVFGDTMDAVIDELKRGSRSMSKGL